MADMRVKEVVEKCGILNKRVWILFAALVVFFVTACGKKADKSYEAEWENRIEDAAGPERGIGEEWTAGNSGEEEVDENNMPEADGEKTDLPAMEEVVMVHVTEDIEYSDEVITPQYVDDLSLLENMRYTNSTYAYQDGKVYYRRYREDSYEETAIWGMYEPVPETQKEIVCIDSDGRETELFSDKGYGDIYLINDRFYMTDQKSGGEDGSVSEYRRLYSVDMQGNDRIDYGKGSIFAIDRVRNIIILEMWETNGRSYYAMDVETGEKTLIELDDGYVNAELYRDGWLYYTAFGEADDDICTLCAISLEGEKREIIALISEINMNPSTYEESILQLEVDEDRVYFVFGGYDGTAHVFQGGTLISVKLDGTDYRAIATEWDAFYLSHENGKTLLYFPRYYYPFHMDPDIKYDMNVWDIDANKCYLTDFPRTILESYRAQTEWTCWYDPGMKGAVCEWTTYGEDPQTDIYAVPDDSGRIVRILMDLGSYITKWQEEETSWIEYQNWYYADGFLYFEVEYRTYDQESNAGWRDVYRRLRTEVYRLKMGESAATMLYAY